MHNTLFRVGLFFTTVDAAMTFGFGMAAAGAFAFKPVMAAALGGASFALAFLPALAVLFWVKYGLRSFPIILGCIAAVGFGFNLVSNTGFTASMFQTEIIAAANDNQIADDGRARLERLRKEDADLAETIGTPGSWMSADEAEAALQRLVAARDREAERGYCGPKCEALDKQAYALKLEIAKAKARERAIERRRQVQKELAEAEKFALENQTVVSVADSQADFVARYMTLDLKPGESVKNWTLMGTALAISIIISVLGWTFNAAAQLVRPDVPNEHDSWAPRAAIPAATAYQPVPLHAEPAPSPVARSSHSETVTTYSYSGHEAPSASQRLRELIEHHQRKAEALRAQT